MKTFVISSIRHVQRVSLEFENSAEARTWVNEKLLYSRDWKIKEVKKERAVCEVCDCEVIFNLDIYRETGMCGTCTTGEARLNYEED